GLNQRSGIRKNSTTLQRTRADTVRTKSHFREGQPMSQPTRGPDRHDYLRRLPPEYYRGRAAVHWSMSMEDRKTGWLIPIFYYKFREILTHAAFRYGFCCPIYCCMPDHLHLLWVGILETCDQRVAARYFRKQF